MRVLCVCLGNICRSPTAEAVLRHRAGGKLSVDSAGTGNWHVGKAPYPPAIAAAQSRGYDLSDLRARVFTPQDFDDFDLILAMDAGNHEDIEAQRPPSNETHVRLFMDYAPQAEVSEVPDPYFTGDFEGAFDLIEAASDGLIKSL